MAVVVDSASGRLYLPATEEQEKLAQSAKPQDIPETDLPTGKLGFRVQNYGMVKHWQLFTQRQLAALTTFRPAGSRCGDEGLHPNSYIRGRSSKLCRRYPYISWYDGQQVRESPFCSLVLGSVLKVQQKGRSW
jgi:hypothetical protein